MDSPPPPPSPPPPLLPPIPATDPLVSLHIYDITQGPNNAVASLASPDPSAYVALVFALTTALETIQSEELRVGLAEMAAALVGVSDEGYVNANKILLIFRDWITIGIATDTTARRSRPSSGPTPQPTPAQHLPWPRSQSSPPSSPPPWVPTPMPMPH
jgi:hypothetical protein